MTYSSKSFPFLPSDPLFFWQQLHPYPTYGFFLGAPGHTSLLIYMSAGEPTRVISNLSQIGHALQKKQTVNAPRFVGCVPFDAGRLFDSGLARLPRRKDPLSMPSLYFGDYPTVVKLDLKNKTTTLYSRQGNKDGNRIDRLLHSTNVIRRSFRPKRIPVRLRLPSYFRFSSMVKKAKEAIARGDIYQANLSLRFATTFDRDPLALYRTLAQKNPSPYAALLKSPAGWVVSNSPELLIQVQDQNMELNLFLN
jgi:anthranilate/para-aminobenzoate synthase component I